MGGKSRKSGGVSKSLIQRLKNERCNAKSKSQKKIKKFLIEDEDDEEINSKRLSKKGKKNRC